MTTPGESKLQADEVRYGRHRLPEAKRIDGRWEPAWAEEVQDLLVVPRMPADRHEEFAMSVLEHTRRRMGTVRDEIIDVSLPEIAAPNRSPPRMGSLLRLSTITVPEGVLSTGPTGLGGIRIAMSTQNAGWWDKAGEVDIRDPAIIRIDPGPRWNQLDDDQQAAALLRYLEELDKRGVRVYGLITSGVAGNVMFKASMDPEAPSGFDYNLDEAIGDYSPAARRKLWSEISATAAGKMLKRDKSDLVGGDHFLTPRVEGGADNVVSVSGLGGQVSIPYEMVDDPQAYEWTDEVGVKQVRRLNTTDGSGDADERIGRRLYRVLTGRPAPRNLKQIQINWQVEQTLLPDGTKTGGTMKALINLVPSKQYRQMQIRDGFNRPMRISSDGLARELANDRYAHGRTIWHFGKPGQWEWAPASGMSAIPMLERHFSLEELGRLHFQHSVEDAYYASDRAKERVPLLADRLQNEMPRGVDENGTLDAGDDQHMRNVRSEATIAQKFQDNEVALRTRSPYASPGAMDTMAGGAVGKLRSLRDRGGGAGEITIPAFKGKRTSALNLPEPDIMPRPGMVRLVEHELRDDRNRKSYGHYVVFNNRDMVDPEQLFQQSGPDNDDEYNAVLGRDRKTGAYKVLVWRDPLPPGGGTLYDAHPEDVRRLRDAGMPILDLNDDYQARSVLHPNMSGFIEAGGGMHPETFDTDQVKQLAAQMSDVNPRTALEAKSKFAAMLLGRGRVPIMFDFIGIAQKSLWIDDAAGWEEWALHQDSLDVEIFGSGHNVRTANQLAEKIVRKVMAGEQVDSSIMAVREGIRDMLGHAYADIQIAELGRAGRTVPRGFRDSMVDEWRGMVEQQGVVHDRWKTIDRWIDAAERAVGRVENVDMSLSNGPAEWLTARRQTTPPRKRRRNQREKAWIQSTRGRDLDVDHYGRYLSDFWNRTNAQTEAYLTSEFKRLDITRNTYANTARRQEMSTHYRSLAWQRIDREIVEAVSEVRKMTNYRDGMLMASFTQNELSRRAERNKPVIESPDEELYVRLRDRVFHGFDKQEQEGYFHHTNGAPRRVAPTIVIDYEGSPWLSMNRETGEIRDIRRTSGLFSWVRYRHEGRLPHDQYPRGSYGIGPFAGTNSKIMADHLHQLSQQGAEFRYIGDLGGRKNRGVFEVKFRSREDLQYSPEQMLAWMEDRYHKGIDPEQLLPMWASLDDMAQLGQEFQTASGRPAVVTSAAIQYGEYDTTRTDFPDAPYEIPLPDDMRRHLPDEAAKMAPAQAPDIDPDTGNMTARQPLPMSAQRDEPPMDRRRITPEDLELIVSTGGVTRDNADLILQRMQAGTLSDEAEDLLLDWIRYQDELQQRRQTPLSRMIAEIKRSKPGLSGRRRASQSQARGDNPEYRPTFAFDDPEFQPVRVLRVGGRSDSMALFVNLLDELEAVYQESFANPGEFWPRGGDVGRPAGVMGPSRDRIGTVVWNSPNLGHFTETRDVARAYHDFVGWTEGRLHPMGPAGLRHAKTDNEAAALVLKDLLIRSEERFWRNREIGYMERYSVISPETGKEVGVQWKHTRGKTDELRTRVKPSLQIRIPTPLAGYTIHPRIQYIGRRRKIVDNWFAELAVPDLFEGNPERWANASMAELADELGRAQAGREAVVLKKLAVALYEKDKRGFTAWGRTYRPGVFQAVDELVDLGVDIREVYRYTTRLMDSLDASGLEVLARVMTRRGAEEVMEKIGYKVLSPEAAIGDRPELVPRNLQWKDTVVGDEFQSFRNIANQTRAALEAGDWEKAGLVLKGIGSTRTAQWIKRHNVVYTQFFGDDIAGRSLGRIMPVAAGDVGSLRATMLLDINTMFDDREINNTIEGIKTAVVKTGWNVLERTNRSLYDKARGLQSRGDQFTKKYGIRATLIDRIFEESYEREFQPRKTGGVNFRIIHRFRWYTMLTQGIGAKMISKAMKDRGVPVQKRWRLNRRAGLDWACWTNANQGWIDNSEDFRSGHFQPPAHPG